MEMTPEVMLQVKNINVFYDKLGVLWDISLDVKKGEIVAIVGSNGAGKSTLLKTISGAIHPKEGSIVFGNQDITIRTSPKWIPIKLLDWVYRRSRKEDTYSLI